MSVEELIALIEKFVDETYPPTSYYGNPTTDEKIDQSPYDALRYFAMWLKDNKLGDS